MFRRDAALIVAGAAFAPAPVGKMLAPIKTPTQKDALAT